MPTLKSEAVMHCENCGKELFGRTDKRFCNDGCRNQFNREKAFRDAQKAHDNLPEIFKIIKRNYGILQTHHPEKLHPDERISFDIADLKADGFNFKFFTSTDEIDGEAYKFCFDIGWLRSGDLCLLVYRPEQAKI
jgi:hypothetical protein